MESKLFYVAGNVPGSPGSEDGNGVVTQVISLLLGFFIGLLVHVLCRKGKSTKSFEASFGEWWSNNKHAASEAMTTTSLIFKMMEKDSPDCSWICLLWPVERPWHRAWDEWWFYLSPTLVCKIAVIIIIIDFIFIPSLSQEMQHRAFCNNRQQI